MILKVENIAKSFGRNKVLKNVSFEMDAASMYGIVGENGSGKSTLLKIIVGEWKLDHGTISVSGRLGYCPQNTLLFSQLTVDEHFRYFAAAYGIEKTESTDRSESLMDYFNFRKYRKEKIAHLSGGTQQKLNLAIALLHRPKLLILDEPYSGFDWDTYSRFWDYTNQLRSEGCAILVVTHLLTEKERFDRIFSLEQGELT
ncbi:MAG: ABC transporter ATP-binding protein [Prolixibacteraceae bacterium]|nr:ABC transporter ATP-binding protein [Prolixibacteraceae bacterium]